MLTLTKPCHPSFPSNGILGAIGNTPLLKIESLSQEYQCTILAKAEFMNPGGSVKDRIAYFMIDEAEKKGLIKPGGTIVEATTGNTGAGLAHACRAKGYKCVIFLPDYLSPEKIQLLIVLGAEVKVCPTKHFDDPESHFNQAKNYALSQPNCYFTNQMDNLNNQEAHYLSTAPEIYKQTLELGKIDAFTCATGTGGTFAGCSRYLKEKFPTIQLILADPPGSEVAKNFGKFQEGEEIKTFAEGVGHVKLSENLKLVKNMVDEVIKIPDSKTIHMLYRMLDEEGLFIGGSAALNLCAAVEVAKKLGPGHTIVTILCDGAYRYQSRIFSKSFLEQKGLIDFIPENLKKFIAYK